LGVWQQFLTGTQDINLTLPDGSVMVLKTLAEIESAATNAVEAATWYANNKTYLEQSGANATAAHTSEVNAAASAALAQQIDTETLKIANNLSEIKDAGPIAQLSARTNLGITGTGGGGGGVQFVDAGTLNEVVITGPALTAGEIVTVAGIVATNTGPVTIAINGAAPVPITAMGGGALQGNELVASSEIVLVITATGATLIATSGGNLPVAPGINPGHAATLGQLNDLKSDTLQITNNLSEIAAEGPASQAIAQANLGIPGGGKGRFLGTILVTASGTYPLPTGTTTILAEVVGGGGGSYGTPATSASAFCLTLPGLPGSWALVQIPVSQLSTAADNEIIISIGAGGVFGPSASPYAGGAGGNTTIDTNVVIAPGGAAGPIYTSYTAATGKFFQPSGVIGSVSVAAPSILLSTKFTQDYYREQPVIGTISATVGILQTQVSSVQQGVSSYGTTFFTSRDVLLMYGAGGSGRWVNVSQTVYPGSGGNQGAARLWFYS
jgi:hypothetical protein